MAETSSEPYKLKASDHFWVFGVEWESRAEEESIFALHVEYDNWSWWNVLIKDGEGYQGSGIRDALKLETEPEPSRKTPEQLEPEPEPPRKTPEQILKEAQQWWRDYEEGRLETNG